MYGIMYQQEPQSGGYCLRTRRHGIPSTTHITEFAVSYVVNQQPAQLLIFKYKTNILLHEYLIFYLESMHDFRCEIRNTKT